MNRRYRIILGFVLLVGAVVWVTVRPRGDSGGVGVGVADPVHPPVASSTLATVPETATEELLSARARISQLEARVRELEEQLEALRPRKTPALGGTQNGRRSWGPEQATGAPDTMQAGDFATAWASLEPDSGPEWLVVDYSKEVEVAQVRVRETLGPGTIFMVSAILADGSEKILWHGTEPMAEAPVEMEFKPSSKVRSRRIRIQLDTSVVKGWNEIDAVELVGTDGTRQWASGAWASSTYADRSGNISGIRKLGTPEPAIATEDEVRAIEAEAAMHKEMQRHIELEVLKKRQDALESAGPRPVGE